MRLLDFLEKYSVTTAPRGHHHVSPGWVGIDCPKCSPDSGRFRLGLNLTSLAAHCWVCGRLNTREMLTELTGLPKRKVWGLLEREESYQTYARQGNTALKVPFGVGELLPAHRDYLERRDFDPDALAKDWGIRGIGPVSERGLEWTLYIPIIFSGETVNWVTRTLKNEGKRYHACPAEWEKVPRNHLLYGEDKCSHTIIVVEGPTDAWRIGTGAVGTFGTSYSHAQLWKLGKYPRRTVCFDNEPPAQMRARGLCTELTAFLGTTHNVLLSAKDPASADTTEIQELRNRFLS